MEEDLAEDANSKIYKSVFKVQLKSTPDNIETTEATLTRVQSFKAALKQIYEVEKAANPDRKI